MSVLNRIKDLANERNMSLAEVERRTGLSSGSITKWGKSSPAAEKLEKIADLFGVSIDYLTGRTDSKEPFPNTSKDLPSSKALTVATRISDDVTDDQMENILNYIDFITSKHKKD